MDLRASHLLPRARRPSSRRRRSGWASFLALLSAGPLAMTVNAGGWNGIVQFTGDNTSYLRTVHSLAASGPTVHAIYDHDDGSVRYRRSANGATTWSAERTIEPPAGSRLRSQPLAIAASGDRVVVVYRADDDATDRHRIFSRRSTDGGLTWLGRTTIATANGSRPMSEADVGLSGTVAVVAWTDAVAGKIRSRRSTDGGATWKPVVELGTTAVSITSGKEGFVSVAVAGTRAYVAWLVAGTGGYNGIALRRSATSGASFAAKQTIETTGVRSVPSLAAAGQTMLLTYGMSNESIKVARSVNGGSTVTRAVAVPGAADTAAGDIFIRGTTARIVYRSLNQLWVRTSSNGGANWGPPDQAFDDLGYRSNVVLAGASTVIVFWHAPDSSHLNVWARRSA